MVIYLPLAIVGFISAYCLSSYFGNRQLTLAISTHWLFWAISALLIWGLVSSLWATNQYLSFEIGLRWLSGWLALIIVVHLLQQKNTEVNYYYWIAYITLPLVLLGVGQYLFDIKWISQPAPPAATFKNKNIFSQYLVIALPLISALYAIETNRLKQWFLGLTATLAVVMIIYAKTRAAWLAVSFQLVLLAVSFVFIKSLASTIKLSNRWLQIGCFALLAIVMVHFDKDGFNPNAVIGIANEAQSIVTEANTERNNGSIRLVNWSNTLIMIKENGLLGVGLGNWQVEYPLYKSKSLQDWMAVSNVIWNYTHNDYLETVASLGVVGAIIMLSMLIGLLMLLVPLRHSTKPIVHTSAMLSLAGLGVTAVFSFPLQLIHSIVYTFCIVGILLAGLGKVRSITLKGGKLLLVTVISLVLLGAVSYLGYAQYKSRDLYREAGKYLRRNDYNAMLPLATEAYRWIPWTKEVLEAKGIAESQLQLREAAAKTYKHYLELYPNTVTALENGTISLMHSGQYAEAMTLVQRLLNIEPNSVIGNINMGTLLYHRKGNYKPQAIQFYKRALQLEPNHPMKATLLQFINKKNE